MVGEPMETYTSTPSPRVPLSFDVSFKKLYSRQETLGSFRNVSLTGAFLDCESHDFQTQDKLAVTVRLSGRVRKLQAVVVWCDSNGVGIKFLPSNGRDTQIIDDLIYFVENKRIGSKGVLDQILNKASHD